MDMTQTFRSFFEDIENVYDPNRTTLIKIYKSLGILHPAQIKWLHYQLLNWKKILQGTFPEIRVIKMGISDNYKSEGCSPNASLLTSIRIKGAFKKNRLHEMTQGALEKLFHEKITRAIEQVFFSTNLLQDIRFAENFPCQISIDLKGDNFTPEEITRIIRSISIESLKTKLETETEKRFRISDLYVHKGTLRITTLWSMNFTEAMLEGVTREIMSFLRKFYRQ